MVRQRTGQSHKGPHRGSDRCGWAEERESQIEFQLWNGYKRPQPVRSEMWMGHADSIWGNSTVARVKHGQQVQRASGTGLCLLSFCETG